MKDEKIKQLEELRNQFKELAKHVQEYEKEHKDDGLHRNK